MTSGYEVWVTPWRAAWARRVLAFAQQQDNNLRIEISAARVIDAYEQGRAAAGGDLEAAIEWVAATLGALGEGSQDVVPVGIPSRLTPIE
jgi:hypothetical protein